VETGVNVLLPLAALAGGLGLVALREAVAATPALAGWVRGAFEPLRRAGSEGYTPTAEERRRLAAVAGVAATAAVAVLIGPGLALASGAGGALLAGSILASRRNRYREAVEHGLPQIAQSVADALSGGASVRSALADAVGSLDGPPAVEMARVRADLALGAPTRAALAALQRRTDSSRIEAFAAALAAQELSGSDVAGLLRRFAASCAERDRVAADARSATAQARFTGLLVVAMPTGAALFAELLEPGFVAGLLGKGAAAICLLMAALLQLAGFGAIKCLSRVGDAR
jgi:tight adherence protein B